MTDSALADHAGNDRPSRRALLGALVGGAAIALAGGRSVTAGTGSGLSDDDLSFASSAIGLELAARDLYDTAIAAGADDEIWFVMREQHEAYAQLLAGIAGISASARDDATFDELAGGFDTGDPASVGFDLENVVAATHLELIGQVDDADLAGAIASFVAMESRHATVLATLSGQGDDFDALFVNSATALEIEA